MKKIILPAILMSLMLLINAPAKSANALSSISIDSNYVAPTDENPETAALIARLNEINAMDKSGLSATEKKELRKELRSINSELKAAGGIYISVGALLIIIILLIVFL